MPKTNTKTSFKACAEDKALALTNSAFELVSWPNISPASVQVSEKVFALQTTRLPATASLPQQNQPSAEKKSPFNSFNLGLHVGDNPEKVTCNRELLKGYISQQLAIIPTDKNQQRIESVDVQWLEQVHGNHVVEIKSVSSTAITADASITRENNIALAIMTADCLPILLSHKNGYEIAAIHGGWRPLAANIIKNTIETMQSKPEDLVAWLGPCIGNKAFEIGEEVKQAFLQQNQIFAGAFVKSSSGKYLADLHQIAKIQLTSLGVKHIASLNDCTYHRTDKYYSYRKEQVTGRMASIICRR